MVVQTKDVVFVVHEGEQGALQLLHVHLAVAHADAGGRHQFLKPGGAGKDGIDAIVDEIDLASAREFLLD